MFPAHFHYCASLPFALQAHSQAFLQYAALFPTARWRHVFSITKLALWLYSVRPASDDIAQLSPPEIANAQSVYLAPVEYLLPGLGFHAYHVSVILFPVAAPYIY